MLVVSDTSPITNLLQVGQLQLLRLIFQEIIIAEAVNEELCRIPEQKEVLAKESWIISRAPSDQSLIKTLKNQLDPGEAASIVLALELRVQNLLIDEKRGRAVAKSLGLQVTGLLGVLLRAKKDGHIDLVRPILERLQEKTSFRVHPKLFQEVLDFAGE